MRADFDDLLSGLREFSGPVLAGGLWAALPMPRLVVGSSSPIRELDLVGECSTRTWRRAGQPVAARIQRGVSMVVGCPGAEGDSCLLARPTA